MLGVCFAVANGIQSDFMMLKIYWGTVRERGSFSAAFQVHFFEPCSPSSSVAVTLWEKPRPGLEDLASRRGDKIR